MFINIVQGLLLIAFIACSVYVLVQDKDNSYGVIVQAGGKRLVNGKQGVQTTFGRLLENDVVNTRAVVSRKHISFTYNGSGVFPDDCFTEKCDSGADYSLAGTGYDFSKPEKLYATDMKIAPVIISIAFTIIRCFAVMQDFGDALLMIPFSLLIAYQVASIFLVVNTAPIAECSFSIFLTFYVYAMLYTSTPETLGNAARKCCVGVAVYVFAAITVKLVLMHISLTKRATKIKPPVLKTLNKNFLTVHDVLLFAASVLIVLLIAFNLIFAKEVNGARNWVYIGSLSIQPSELIKVLLLFIVTIPVNKRFDDLSNAYYLLLIPGVCFLYCLVIKDVGALIEMAAIWVLAVILQSANPLITGLVCAGMFFGVKLVLRVSATAAQRFDGWFTANIWDALASKGTFENEFTSGYQSVNAIVAAVANGGAFGMKYYDVDVMANIEAAHSDLVMSIICQRYGYIIMFLLLFILAVVFASGLLNLKKQTKSQQILSILSLFLILTANLLNIGGSFGIIPLTGVVLPYFSYGISSAVSYGAVMGIITSFSHDAYSIVNSTKLTPRDKTFIDFMKSSYKKAKKRLNKGGAYHG